MDIDVEGTPYIPILDDPFDGNELQSAMNKVNKNITDYVQV